MSESINDPTRQGIPISHDAVVQYRDVFDYVRQHMDENTLAGQSPAAVMDAFINKARELFTINQPISHDTMSHVMAIRFQDGLILSFCDIPPEFSGMSGIGGAMSISKVVPPRGNDGKGTTVKTPSWGITAGE